MQRGEEVSIILSFGKWGGFYWFNGYTKRLCLGWFAITFIPQDYDVMMHKIKDRIEETKR